MRIKKLELIGFKSFKDRTVIQFDAGITGIVGPNGCGKSNIVDALVWVMGEMSAKDLRGSQMTDVIFAGAEGYAPMGMAEVSLTLENDGGPFPAKYMRFSEVMVTRRLHRNGESDYFVNKEPARLRDIQEIFMDTGAGSKGFSIIQQGMIGKIITSKPEDRRTLIEEAAGITKFKARKKESQRKLQATDQNLVRLQDIIGELKRQLDSLQRQAQRAERYRNLKKQIEDLDLCLSSRQFADLKQACEEAQHIFDEAQSMEISGATNLDGLQSELEQLKLQVLEQEQRIDEIQSEFSEKQILVQRSELEIQKLKFEIEKAQQSEQMTGSLLQEQKARLDLLQRDLNHFETSHAELKSQAEELNQNYQSKNEIYQESQSRILEVDEDLTTKRRELFALGQSESSLDARSQSLSTQMEDQQERVEHEQSVLAELKEKQIQFEERQQKLALDLEAHLLVQSENKESFAAVEVQKKELQDRISEKKSEVDLFKDQLNQVTSRLYGLENLQNNFEGFEEGVKQVMLWQKAKETSVDGSVVPVFHPVAEVVEVPSQYELAMESALGSRLQMLLSPQQDLTVEAVSHLKEQNSGRSSFFSSADQEQASNWVMPRSAAPSSEEGVHAILKDVVQSSARYEKSVSYLLDGVAVVDSLRTALRLRPLYQGWTFVTMDGDTLGADGVLTGGSVESADSGVLKRRREIKELSQQKDEWSGKLALVTASLKKMEEEMTSLQSKLDDLQKKKIELEIRGTELRKDAERAETERYNAETAYQRQERELSRLNDQLRVQEEKLEELQNHLNEVREKKFALESEVENLTEDLTNTRMGFDGLQQEVTTLQVQAASKNQEAQGVERQLLMVRRQVEDLQQALSRMSEESEKNNVVMSENQLALEEKKIEFERLAHEVEELQTQLSHANDYYEQIESQRSDLETEVQMSQKAKNERQSRMNESQLKLEQAKMKEQYLVDQMRERYMLNLPDVYQNYLDRQVEAADAEVQLKDLREKLSKIGEVNLSAIEEYQESSQRYEFLTKQQEDLIEAKEQLRRVIDRINRICSRRFKETFDLVNDRFTRVFPVLFGGGEAKLELHEDPEKQEMGVEIIARPPGKKMQSVTLMSGGEKALTAVALVFSIFLVKPSPYCLLDEVDAPLDDANVFRFNDLVREMSKRSQIIVVTHNKHTMEVAKKLYGVTMQERGVSTMVSVNLGDIR